MSDKHAFLPLPELSEPSSMYLERASDIGFYVIIIVYVWRVFLLLAAIGSLSFVVALRGHLF